MPHLVQLAAIALLLATAFEPFRTSCMAQGASAPSGELVHGLQNMTFIGPLGVQNERNPADDVLSFESEKFSSRTCAEWGFSPAPYWVRRDAAGLHFHAELRSAEHGVMQFQGVFDGKELLATAVWKKVRWYWTVEQRFRFKGKPLRSTQ
jgi:hypothetical protein